MPEAAAYELRETAALKILLHAAKFPYAAVNGVLIGTVSQGSADSPDSAQSQTAVTIVDAVPLFHTFLSLAPMLETALAQVASFVQQQGSGLHIVGLYHANANLADKDFGPTARKIADRIAQKQPAACAIQVDNAKLGAFFSQETDDVLQLWLRDGSNNWKSSTGAFHLKSQGLASQYQQLHASQAHKRLHDFDEHLNDITKDWLNDGLLAAA